MKRRSLYELLRADGSIVINKNLARAIGLNEAVIYSELLSRYFYFDERGRLGPDGYFYNTLADLESGTTLTQRQQDPAIKKLLKLGLIKSKLAGIPAKRHFKIVDDADLLMSILDGGRVIAGKSVKYLLSDDNMPDILREKLQAVIDSYRAAGATKDITPAQLLEMLAK